MKIWLCRKNAHITVEDSIISVGESRPRWCPACGSGDAIESVSKTSCGIAGGPDRWAPKSMIEMLVKQTGYIYQMPNQNAATTAIHRAMVDLLGLLELARPTKSDGKHGTMHTPLCGCEDK